MAGERDHGGGPPRLERVKPAARAPGADVTPAAALAAGLPLAAPLEGTSPLHLCYLAASAQSTGTLTLEGERSTAALHFRRGVLEHAASTAPEDALGPFLVARGLLGEAALADAERVRDSFGGDLVTALAHLRLLNPAESFRVLQEHGVAVAARAMALDRGRFRWDPSAKAPPSAFPLGSRWGLPCDAARRLDGLAVRKLLGDRAQRAAGRAGGRVELSELKLTAHEARAATLFDGSASPAQLAAAHPSDADVILRVALLLGEMELLAFGAEVAGVAPGPAARARSSATSTANANENASSNTNTNANPNANANTNTNTSASASANTNTNTNPNTNPNATPTPRPNPNAARSPAPSRPPAAAAPRPAVPAKPAAAPKPVAVPQDPAALQALYDRLATADHFEALGVKRDAPLAQVKAAYFQLAKTYHPDAAPASEPPATKKLRADVFARLGEAWRVLGDDASRAAYVEELATGGGAQVDVSAIFEAEQAFQKAVVLVRARQYDKAGALLSDALKLNPDEPEFGVWKAWVDFLVASDRKRQMAASAAVIEAALHQNARCMPGYLFLGQMARLQGDLALAEKHLKRGLALDPDNGELARELKFVRK